MNLFQTGRFLLASGAESSWKIECDALTVEDWKTLARLIAERVPTFGEVSGVPRGGLTLASYLWPYALCECGHSLEEHGGHAWTGQGEPPSHCSQNCGCRALHLQRSVLLVDDVWTTGGSMRRWLSETLRPDVSYCGAVVFARGEVDPWVTALWTLAPERKGGVFMMNQTTGDALNWARREAGLPDLPSPAVPG